MSLYRFTVIFDGPNNLELVIPGTGQRAWIPKDKNSSVLCHFAVHRDRDVQEGIQNSVWGVLHAYFCTPPGVSTSKWPECVQAIYNASNAVCRYNLDVGLCAFCNKVATLVCSRCKMTNRTLYCSRTCQINDHENHRKSCK